MRLMIVDDEDLEHEGLSQMIRRLGLDIELCGNAWNGQEALALAERLLPDIAVTDVRMPVMDGIEFARQLRRRQPGCSILIISGYEDFQAAKEALLLGANAWLAKPVNQDELRQVLARICDIAHTQARKQAQEEWRERRLQQVLPLERRDFLQAVLLGREQGDAGALAKRAQALGIPLHQGRFAVLAGELQETQEHLDRQTEERFAAFGDGAGADEQAVPMPGLRLALVMAFPTIAGEAIIQSRLEAAAEQLRLQMSTACGACAGVGVSQVGDSISGLSQLYGQACQALSEKALLGRGRVIFHSGVQAEARSFSRNEQITRQVCRLVQGDLGGDLSAEAIAARVYLTASHLRRVFKNIMGVTLQDYVLRTRMERARELLADPASRVHAVASQMGYESTSYFCMVFKRFFGVSPGEFKAGAGSGDQEGRP